MLRWMLPLAVLGFVVLALPGCLHHDQDYVAQNMAQQIATLPRDTETQTVLAMPKPKLEFQPAKAPQEKLKLPEGLPGSDAPPLVVPPIDRDKLLDPQQAKALQGMYPILPALEPEFKPGPLPNGQPFDLPALQALALSNNPVVQQAVADVQAARGVAIQAGMYPNPVVGFEGDSIGQAGTNGQLGGFIDQTIKTAGKLQLARSAGAVDMGSAELALRRTQVEVMTAVRSHYFAVLVAQENVVIARAMAELSDEVYRLHVNTVKGGALGAPYEPLQLNVLAVQARANLVQARNRYLAAWRQLAAALGTPGLPPTQLAGRADVPPPGYAFDAIRDHVLTNHTDIAIASNTILKSRFLLQLAQVTPIPDVLTHFVVQNDNTSEPNRVQVGIQLGVAIPVWDRNQGNILTAQAQLARANRDVARVQNDLSQRLAEAYERYRNSIALTTDYRDSILPNQVRVYRALYQRFDQLPAQVQYSDVVVAQQTLAAALQTYVQNLSGQWQAVVDLAALLQTDDIYQLTVPGQSCPPGMPVSMMLDPRTWTAATPEMPQAPTVLPEPSRPQASLGFSSAPGGH